MPQRPQWEPVIRPVRKILCTAVLAAILLGGDAAAAGAGEVPPGGRPADLLGADLFQAGRNLVFTVRTAAPVPLASLERLPDPGNPAARYLCLALRRAGGEGERRLCLGGPGHLYRRAGLELLGGAGRPIRKATLTALVKGPSPTRLTLVLAPGEAGLTPHRYRWRVLEDRGGCEAAASEGCEERLPADGFLDFRLRPVRPVGCTGGTAGLVRSGPRNRKLVALTFDDGPSTYTPGFLSVLRREHVRATFFEVGQEMAGRTATMRRILREGSEIGNHTMHHGFYPGYADLAATDARIRAATHFEPCLFRPPGGAFSPAVVAAAGQAGLKTILWDVDPVDWSTPGAGAIYSRVVGAAQRGSIVLMHDGGGNRSETLAALPSIIATLRARGYAFATVSELLGQRMVYEPYG